MNGFLGEPFKWGHLRGAPQGDSFSMVLMNVSTFVWFCIQQQGIEEEELRAALEELPEDKKEDALVSSFFAGLAAATGAFFFWGGQ